MIERGSQAHQQKPEQTRETSRNTSIATCSFFSTEPIRIDNAERIRHWRFGDKIIQPCEWSVPLFIVCEEEQANASSSPSAKPGPEGFSIPGNRKCRHVLEAWSRGVKRGRAIPHARRVSPTRVDFPGERSCFRRYSFAVPSRSSSGAH